MLSAKVDITNLQRAMREFTLTARADIETVVRQQSAIMVGHLIAITPPAPAKGQAMSDNGTVQLDAKKRGEARIAADIAALFPTTKLDKKTIAALNANGFEYGTGRGKKIIKKYAGSISELRRIHKLARSKATGRTKTGKGEMMALTKLSLRKAYIKAEQQKVGTLSGGWVKAGKAMKTSARAMPAWVNRHGRGAGGAYVAGRKHEYSVRLQNDINYFPKDMGSRMQMTIARRERGLKKATEAIINRRAAKRFNEQMK